MNRIFLSKNTLNNFLLFLFPIIYLIIGSYFRTVLGHLSLRSIDPDYQYFSNGLGVSLGVFDSGNIFHPGSPLQYFVALIFRLVYLIRSPEISYLEDILSHPDLYMSIVSFSISILISFCLLIAGSYVLKLTGSVLYGLLIQTVPFLPLIWYDLIGRVVPEVFQAIPVLALSVLIIYYYKQNKVIHSYGSLLFLAFIMAFGLSVKVTFIPLLLIPFLIIESKKKKIFFIGFTLLFFLFISLSVLLKIEFFWNWIKNIFLHSGDYGGGEKNILNFSDFKINLKNIIEIESFFFLIVLILWLMIFLYLILWRKKAEKRTVIYALSVVITVSIHLLIVSKHFAHRNFIPSLLLLPLIVFFCIEIIRKMLPSRLIKYIPNFLLFLIILLILRNQFSQLPIKAKVMGNDISIREETKCFTSLLDSRSIKIITTQDYGCPFIEYALMYSQIYAEHSLKPLYSEVLAKLYPDTYQYTTWDDHFRYWGEQFNVKNIIESGRQVYLYLERDDEVLYDRTINKLSEESPSPFTAGRELVFRNEKSTEVIYLLNFVLATMQEEN